MQTTNRQQPPYPSLRGLRRLVRTALAVGSLLICASTRAENPQDAAALYDSGKFTEAKQRFEKQVASGPWSANLFYNLGDVEFRLGAKGRAALQFERALALAPGHPEASRNLQFVREKAGSRIEEASWSDRLFPESSTNILCVAGALAFWAALGLLAWRWGAPQPVNFWPGFLGCVLLTAYCAAGIWKQSANTVLAIIVVDHAEAKLAPADRAAVAESLPAGSRVRVLSERGEWIYCTLPGNGLGWLPAQSLEKVQLPRS